MNFQEKFHKGSGCKGQINDRKFCKDFLLYGFIGAFIFVSIYGLLPLDIKYDRWLINGYIEKDTMQHYAGWLEYRDSPWTFPLGKVDRPTGTILTFTDSIPTIAIICKLFRAILPETFQYFGFYILLCFILQGISSGMLIRLFTKDRFIIIPGVILFCFSPIMIERAFRHSALASHWLILFMLYFYFYARRSKKFSVASVILPVMAIGIHPYFLPILFGLMFASMIELFIYDRKTLKRSALSILCSVFLTVVFGYLIGAIGTSSVTDIGGYDFVYGYFSMNLNAIFNPISCGSIKWSVFLRVLPQILGNFDGFNYLGMGTILLLLAAIILCFLKRHKLKIFLRHNVVLLFLSLFFFLFAVSNVITLNDKILLEIPLQKDILALASIFRASSRIFYPVYYLIMLCGLVIIAKDSVRRRIIIICALVIQLVDISPALVTKYHSFTRDTIDSVYFHTRITGNNLWESAVTKVKKIKVLEEIKDVKLAVYGDKYQLDPDIPITNDHLQIGDLNELYSSYVQELTENSIDPDALYITKQIDFIEDIRQDLNINIYYDGYYFMIVSDQIELRGEKIEL